MTPLAIPRVLLRQAQAVADDFAARTGVAIDATELLTGRAALLGIAPDRQDSAGGATRLLAALDGWCALTLSRPDDIAMIPALLQVDSVETDSWPAIRAWAAETSVTEVATRARLLGLPVGVLGETAPAPPLVSPLGPTRAGSLAGLLVADLSSMWAGPLCGQLLVRAGATVVKVESWNRPDGTRAGAPEFFDWMNGGKLSYATDFDDPRDLAALLSVADVVIEASRPAALARRGLGPDTVADRPGRIWLRITGHGSDGEKADWVAFGDDAAVSGGLVGYRDGAPVFSGDAIADPLTGLHAAAAVAASRECGGGELIEFSMAAVAAGYRSRNSEVVDTDVVPVRPAAGPAGRELGADNEAVRRLVAERAAAPC
ncbi:MULTISPECIES: CoA transferase [unclassified Mycolicibacterium]|uniref:CoA transferase n=1 Tax=unclassified Mycolicibacterium TaxID=2636767 RepID=UPI0012DE23B0|nr:MULTISPECIES: CoA transferase [unclassified Mycolicibacterium]MUL82703.1 CoA transferase [Mycolicibacterium sp. CBMA 329]MUL89038.1 CoA transferase [Mycolicibacterium sp. CBMA 331]MUL97605.1 CoA transferase [Mycolicibacterium sp. CBMA 334]MUM38554.1 CoA transferase [Mycolicibacterium sp. CBMA 247]MUM45102.1 CoA transferase [Mycolicibacterium sp. CBMA 294]